MYVARGLLPVTPVLGFAGQAATGPIGGELQLATPTPEAMPAIDLAAYGFDRAVDGHALARRRGALHLQLQAPNDHACSNALVARLAPLMPRGKPR